MRTGMLWLCLLTTNIAVTSVALTLYGLDRRVQTLEARVATPSPSPVWTTCDFAEERGVPCTRVPE